MDPQLVDWGGSAVLLGIFWQLMAWSMRRLTRRLDRQDKDLAELKTDVAGLKRDVTGLAEGQAELRADMKAGQAELKADMKAGQAELKGGQVRLEDHIIQLAGGLGEVKGELKRIAPREKATAAGS
ncbi:MAG: hypothetical protein OXI84_06930 [bacterium]|nr:hypothetical protein [bacterium]